MKIILIACIALVFGGCSIVEHRVDKRVDEITEKFEDAQCKALEVRVERLEQKVDRLQD